MNLTDRLDRGFGKASHKKGHPATEPGRLSEKRPGSGVSARDHHDQTSVRLHDFTVQQMCAPPLKSQVLPELGRYLRRATHIDGTFTCFGQVFFGSCAPSPSGGQRNPQVNWARKVYSECQNKCPSSLEENGCLSNQRLDRYQSQWSGCHW